jgi:hypothetical protein
MIKESTKQRYAGMRYGKLTILNITRTDPKNTHHYFALCKCDCGVEKEMRLFAIKKHQACGCVGKENRKKANTGNTYSRHPFGEFAKKTLIKFYKHHAKKRNIAFNLSDNEFFNITKKNCFYCGVEPKQIMQPKGAYGDYVYNGVDRVDNSLPYIASNCVAACRPCNSKKNAITKEMIFKIYHFLFPRT